MSDTKAGRRFSRAVVIALVLALITAGGMWWLFSGTGEKRVTAMFSHAVGVYAGSDVRLLGVRIGEVETVTPRGELVEVAVRIEGDAPVTADSNAVVVAPSVVADRYVQFAGLAKAGTARISDGTTIPVDRTATPVELDELYVSLNDLTTALGPDGVNSDGALNELLDTGAANLDGNGKAFGDNIRDLAGLARTLSGSKDDLFGTVDELQKFTTMLAGNDQQISTINQQLAQIAASLNEDREELSGALRELGAALGQIQGFIRDNREHIKSNVDKLAGTTQLLVDRRSSLAQTLDVAPIAADNLISAFDRNSGTLQGRTNLLEYVPGAAGGGAGMVAVPEGQAPPASAPELPLPTSGTVFVPGVAK